jgi:hypothetical protein
MEISDLYCVVPFNISEKECVAVLSVKMLTFVRNYVLKYWSKYCIGAGARGSIVVKALCYKPEGCGFDTQ